MTNATNEVKFKTLYVLISNAGDGSYYTNYILDPIVIEIMKKADQMDLLDYEYDMGVDGDGFHYSEIKIPDYLTPEMMGISVYTMEDLKKNKRVMTLVEDKFSKLNKP